MNYYHMRDLLCILLQPIKLSSEFKRNMVCGIIMILICSVALYCFFFCSPSYARMYKDVRAAVDLCHRDGTLKQMVAKDPER